MSVHLMNDVWEGAPHSGGTFNVLLALADNADDATGYCYPGMEYLAWKTRQSVRNVQYCIKQLADEEWISVSVGTGDHGCNEYYLNTARLKVAAVERRRLFEAERKKKKGEKIAPSNPFHGRKDCTPAVQPNLEGVQVETDGVQVDADGGEVGCTRTTINPSTQPSDGILDPAPPVTPSIRPEEYANCWNRNRGPLPKVESFTDTRRKKILSRQRQGISLEMFERAVKHCANSPFLTGANNQGWTATFDWLIANDSNAIKVLEGQYAAKENGGMKHASNGQLHSANRDVLNRVLGGPKAAAGGELPLRSITALESPAGGRLGEVLAAAGDEVHAAGDQGRF